MAFNPAAWLGKRFVDWLTSDHMPVNLPICDFDRVRYEVRPCDVILVEGRSRVSDIIRSITQSTWSHAALYIGRIHDIDDKELREKILSFYDGDPHEQLIIEAWLGKGTMVNPLHKYREDSLRICRPTGLSRQDAQHVLKYALHHLGFEYDLRQLLDLARFLFPYSILPRRWRSSLFQHNAGSPTRSVCSSMIAAAFASVKFPVLPVLEQLQDGSFQIVPRNSRLFTPRDFDYSPYFDIIKCPLTEYGKLPSYRELPWDTQGRICNADGDCFVPAMQTQVRADSGTDPLHDRPDEHTADTEADPLAVTTGKAT